MSRRLQAQLMRLAMALALMITIGGSLSAQVSASGSLIDSAPQALSAGPSDSLRLRTTLNGLGDGEVCLPGVYLGRITAGSGHYVGQLLSVGSFTIEVTSIKDGGEITGFVVTAGVYDNIVIHAGGGQDTFTDPTGPFEHGLSFVAFCANTAPSATATNTPTNTPVPPTNTATNTPTNTPVPPTNTATNTPTNTPVPPTNTSTNTPTNTPIIVDETNTATPSVTSTDEAEKKTELCHATHSDTNPFEKITVSVSAAFHGHLGTGNGNDHQDGEDIIPPFEYQGVTYSQNWPEGQAFFDNGCAELPTSTATLEIVTETPTSEIPTETATTEVVTETATIEVVTETPAATNTPIIVDETETPASSTTPIIVDETETPVPTEDVEETPELETPVDSVVVTEVPATEVAEDSTATPEKQETVDAVSVGTGEDLPESGVGTAYNSGSFGALIALGLLALLVGGLGMRLRPSTANSRRR